jgi:hypothetical protein
VGVFEQTETRDEESSPQEIVISSRSEESPCEAQTDAPVSGSFSNEFPRAHARAASPGDSLLRFGMTRWRGNRLRKAIEMRSDIRVLSGLRSASFLEDEG